MTSAVKRLSVHEDPVGAVKKGGSLSATGIPSALFRSRTAVTRSSSTVSAETSSADNTR